MKAGDDDGCAVHSGETFARTAKLYATDSRVCFV